MATSYIPDEGDVVWVNFSPQSGHEQAGRRPAVVLSRKTYNIKNLDWQARQAERKGKVTPAELAEIKSKIKSLLGLA